MWIVNFIREIRLIRFIKNTYKKNEKLFLEKNLKIDWLGQIYTVLNRPDGVTIGSDVDYDMLVRELLDINQVMEFLNLQFMLSFICEPHTSEDENFYLVVFTPTLSSKGTSNYVTKRAVMSMIFALLLLIISLIVFIILI